MSLCVREHFTFHPANQRFWRTLSCGKMAQLRANRRFWRTIGEGTERTHSANHGFAHLVRPISRRKSRGSNPGAVLGTNASSWRLTVGSLTATSSVSRRESARSRSRGRSSRPRRRQCRRSWSDSLCTADPHQQRRGRSDGEHLAESRTQPRQLRGRHTAPVLLSVADAGSGSVQESDPPIRPRASCFPLPPRNSPLEIRGLTLTPAASQSKQQSGRPAQQRAGGR